MRQLSSAILIAGGVGVLVVGVNLLRSMTEQPASATPTTRPRPAPTPPAPGPAPAPSAPTPARSAAKAITSIKHDLVAARERPVSNSPAPALTPDQPPPGYGSAHLEYGSKQLHAQVRAVEPLVKQCVAAAADRSPTGTVQMSFIVGKHGDKYTVESTDYDYDKTTLDDPDLVKCLTETARAMKFVGLPRDSPAIVVRRSVSVDHGKLSAYKYVNFSYLR